MKRLLVILAWVLLIICVSIPMYPLYIILSPSYSMMPLEVALGVFAVLVVAYLPIYYYLIGFGIWSLFVITIEAFDGV